MSSSPQSSTHRPLPPLPRYAAGGQRSGKTSEEEKVFLLYIVQTEGVGGGEVQPESKSVEVVWSLLDNVQKKDVFFYVFPEYHGFLTYCGLYDCVLASVPVE